MEAFQKPESEPRVVLGGGIDRARHYSIPWLERAIVDDWTYGTPVTGARTRVEVRAYYMSQTLATSESSVIRVVSRQSSHCHRYRFVRMSVKS